MEADTLTAGRPAGRKAPTGTNLKLARERAIPKEARISLVG